MDPVFSFILVALTWIILSRSLYVLYINYVQERQTCTYETYDRTVKDKFWPYKAKVEETQVFSWDTYHMLPILGDFYLAVWMLPYLFQMLSLFLHKRQKEAKKRKN